MDKTQLEKAIERGLEAEHFLQFIEREAYFKSLFQEIDQNLVNAIVGLDPHNTAAFTILQAKRMSLYEPINMVHRDIELGKRAQAEVLSEGQKEGIL
jgi:hypothetical protein